MKSTISKINVIPCPVTDLYQHTAILSPTENLYKNLKLFIHSLAQL